MLTGKENYFPVAKETLKSVKKYYVSFLLLPKPLTTMEQNGPSIYYNVFHRQSGTQSSRMQMDKVRYGSSLIVRGAEYYVQYEFQIQAGNDFGVGPMSPIVNGFTGERRKYT